MKHFLILSCCLFSLTSVVFAQEYKVKAGTRMSSTFKFTDIYQYPSFTAGRVLFKDGRSGASKMNYNIFTSEIEFIEGKDTLALGDKESIKAISIGTDAFYYQNIAGYLCRLSETGYTKLSVKRTFRLYDRQRDAGYGKASSVNNTGAPSNNVIATGALNNSTSGSDLTNKSIPGRTLGFVTNEDVIYHKLTEYYIGNAKGVFLRAEKKNLVKAYPEKKASISAYLKENNVDWDDEESLKKLLVIITDMK